MSDPSHNEHSVQIEREKTKRTYAYLGVFGTLGLIAIVLFYLNVGQGSLKVSTDGIEVTVDQPLIQQVQAESRAIEIDGDTVSMTTGSVPDSVVRQIEAEQKITLSSDAFVGKNLINRSQGFVVSTARPELWKIDPKTLEGNTKVLSLRTARGSRLTVDTIAPSTCQDLSCAIRVVSRDAATRPKVDQDARSQTAVITFTDGNQRSVVVKLLRQDDHWVSVRGEVAATATAEERKELITSVTTFSLIVKK